MATNKRQSQSQASSAKLYTGDAMDSWYNPTDHDQAVDFLDDHNNKQRFVVGPGETKDFPRKWRQAIRITDDRGNILCGGAPYLALASEGEQEADLPEPLRAEEQAEEARLQEAIERLQKDEARAKAKESLERVRLEKEAAAAQLKKGK